MADRLYFGTDGIRGPVGVDPITPTFFEKLGYVVGQQAEFFSKHQTVILAQDPRESGASLVLALANGFRQAGREVVLQGILPTPTLAQAVARYDYALGAVVTASHNPFSDNGVKFFTDEGKKLSDAQEYAIEAALAACAAIHPLPLGALHSANPDLLTDYSASAIARVGKLPPYRLVVDCANGAMSAVAPAVLTQLGLSVHCIHVEPDGQNINAGCGATDLSSLSQAVCAQQADLGVAFDGDGDRLMLVDAKGEVLAGDQVLAYLTAQLPLAQMQSTGVVGTVMTNLAFEQFCLDQKIPFYRASVGDRYIADALFARGWPLGAESSGHLIYLPWAPCGDGLLSLLHVLQRLDPQRPVAEQIGALALCPQVLINVPMEKAQWLAKQARILACGSMIETQYAAQARVLIRPSGTEPVLRVMVEAAEANLAAELAERIVKEISFL
jgi:phosphoglucosamine mutase